jgi:hypothetical protein
MDSGKYPAPIPVSTQKIAGILPDSVPNRTGFTCRILSGIDAE